MYDLAIPKNNEQELDARAREVGSNLLFLYEMKTEKELEFIQRKLSVYGLKNRVGLLIKVSKKSDLNVRQRILSAVDLVVATSTSLDMIREIVSSKDVDLFVDIATSTGRDHTHYRRGNFNQVFAKEAKNNEQSYLLDFNRILKIGGQKRALLLGRIMQNIRFCNKYDVPVLIASFADDVYGLRSIDNLKAFARVLKAKPKSLNTVLDEKARASQYIRKGVRLIK